MANTHQQNAVKSFVAAWLGKGGDEKSQTQTFWLSLLRDIFAIEHPESFIQFEVRVRDEKSKKFIDGYLPTTRVLIEQKGGSKKLDVPEPQSDGERLTPFQQAKRYADNLEYSKKPRWIVTCNFTEFRIYDLDRQNPEASPEIIALADLPTQWQRLTFLVDPGDTFVKKEMEVSVKAGELVGKLYDAMLAQYDDPKAPATLKSLNVLCVRLVFCLYAEDAGIFGKHMMFYNFVRSYKPNQLADNLKLLFAILATPEAERKSKDPDLLAFPYVNGGLFTHDDSLEYPVFTQELVDLLAENASAGFDWKDISPTIFGAVFESTLNPESRRQGGMHYTSIENIHKVIDPLFLDSLKAEFAAIKKIKVRTTLVKKLQAFIVGLGKLKFFDPACGSGNFLTETYICLRRLENEALAIMHSGQRQLLSPVSVSIGQFYGIEINDFAVSVARTALWIAESQMYNETEDIYHQEQDYLPLKAYPNIVEGNALRMDWGEVISPEDVHYIMGNPPFVGARMKNNEQRDDVLAIFGSRWPNVGDLDYVACWFKKVADMMTGQRATAALVATNSICQGSAVANLWKYLFADGAHINFAHKTFRWDSESRGQAHVHCVIVGFSKANTCEQKIVFDNGNKATVKNINGYLLDAKNVFVESRNEPICDVPKIGIGNKPIDGGNYLFTAEEKEKFIANEPKSEKWFCEWYGAKEFLDNKPRFFLWLKHCSPAELKEMPECCKRIDAVKKFRLQSKSAGTRNIAETPLKFHVENFPNGNYIVIPEVTSERREYIPVGFMSPNVLCSNLVKISESATLYHFGILTSSSHNAWMRTVAGRLEMRYRYSAKIVYNNFPWPEADETQQAKIATLAQTILDTRAKYPDSSLATLYDPTLMPPDLRKAHTTLDKAVLALYGLKASASEPEIVAMLFDRYAALTAQPEELDDSRPR